jgi:hypothetical protein
MRVPEMDNEHQRITPWVVIEYCFHWRVRQNPTIPIKISVDARGGKCRRQRAPCVWRATKEPGGWRNRSNGPAVPLSRIQTDVFRVLAAHRDPESDVAAATPLNRNAPRISSGIDVSHDREERVAAAALE